MKDIRRAIRDQALKAVGAAPAAERRAPAPPVDGLFEQGSIVRRVHGDIATMMIGGVASLLLQMLHPSALAGVWDHSDFRSDMAGRLRRTARFVSLTTYGAREDALRSIGRVRAIHERVVGELPDGTPYRANDPALLAFVHVAETRCFLKSYVRYREPDLTLREQDRYFAEMARVAHALGCDEVPVSVAGAERYLEDVRPQLRWDRRTRRVASQLLAQPALSPALAPVNATIMDAGVDLLPLWAADMHGFATRPLARRAVRMRAKGAGALLRWAMSADAAA